MVLMTGAKYWTREHISNNPVLSLPIHACGISLYRCHSIPRNDISVSAPRSTALLPRAEKKGR